MQLPEEHGEDEDQGEEGPLHLPGQPEHVVAQQEEDYSSAHCGKRGDPFLYRNLWRGRRECEIIGRDVQQKICVCTLDFCLMLSKAYWRCTSPQATMDAIPDHERMMALT